MNKIYVVLVVIVLFMVVVTASVWKMGINSAPVSTATPGATTGVQSSATGKAADTATQNATLDMSNQGITKVPMDIFSRTELVELNLSGNSLNGSLPAEIRLLKKLKVLNLSNNTFTGLPAEIGQLQDLEVLDVSNNQLTGLPHELGNLSNLTLLNIKGNSYSKTDLDSIRQTLPATTVILTD